MLFRSGEPKVPKLFYALEDCEICTFTILLGKGNNLALFLTNFRYLLKFIEFLTNFVNPAANAAVQRRSKRILEKSNE